MIDFIGILLGVFDGHGGKDCAQVISKRLFHYVSACLLPPNILKQFLNTDLRKALKLLKTFNDELKFIEKINDLYETSFLKFVRDLAHAESKKEFNMESAMENAFVRLDNDLSNEALTKGSKIEQIKTLAVAMSGAVAAVAHIDGPHLHVAGVGDCQAVVGVLSGIKLPFYNIISK